MSQSGSRSWSLFVLRSMEHAWNPRDRPHPGLLPQERETVARELELHRKRAAGERVREETR